MRRLALLALVTVWVGADSALAVPPQTPPALCAGDAFGDLLGTTADDRLQAPPKATRVWGFEGADRLAGSATRAACLIGGPGRDVLALNGGGGLAYGNQGRDTIVGSARGDVIDAGFDTDAVDAEGGDDKVGVRDGSPEVVDCGDGEDIVKADRRDVLIGCESVNAAGPRPTRLHAVPDQTSPSGMVRVRLTVPRAAGPGAYRLIYVTGRGGLACGGGPVEVARLPAEGARVQRGQRVRVGAYAPTGGWCPGSARVAVVRSPGDGLPLVAVARFSFSVR